MNEMLKKSSDHRTLNNSSSSSSSSSKSSRKCSNKKSLIITSSSSGGGGGGGLKSTFIDYKTPISTTGCNSSNSQTSSSSSDIDPNINRFINQIFDQKQQQQQQHQQNSQSISKQQSENDWINCKAINLGEYSGITLSDAQPKSNVEIMANKSSMAGKSKNMMINRSSSHKNNDLSIIITKDQDK
ncbi:uncharacterized protein LOC124493730 [Dermatophagoides farinae]|uniref:uncharacterized protein LOC124493730 n=1 Tax=Dermatophagoides farinae TaxID=6954 RepID=UPI003F61854B